MRFAIKTLALLGMVVNGFGQSPGTGLLRVLHTARKLVVVTTTDWNDVKGTLTRYESRNGKWRQVGDAIPVVVGKNGLAWDPRLARTDSVVYPGPVKHEGDGRSPAGIFQLENIFGFEPALSGSNTYLPLTSNTECVDDPASRYYARVVDRQKVGVVDWNSSEKMRDVPGYRWGVIVSYNMDRTIKGDGSCIFLHQWNGPASGTAGCTAMAAADIEAVVQWLTGEEAAVLVQLPKSEYQHARQKWQLP
jgi:D-alanyl-D-alanine dipeptidase